MNSRFKAGSALFECIHCGRRTRDTNGDNGKAEMCEDCYEGSMQENGALDGGAEAAQYEADMRACYQRAVDKGGVIAGYEARS
jgi:hypothetical protein